MKIEDKAEAWANHHAFDIQTRGAMERAEACKEAYMAGASECLKIAIALLKQLRPEMGGLGAPIFILQEILDGKAEIPEEVSE